MNVEVLKGQILKDIQVSDNRVLFINFNGNKYELVHNQDCCESVWIEDIDGDINDLIDSEILLAEEVSNIDISNSTINVDDYESYTWTFYKFATIKGYVTIRFFGESNGYYSEGVDFDQIC